MGKRGPKKGQGGRPQGSGIGKYRGGPAKTPPAVRDYWRDYKRVERIMLGSPSPPPKKKGKK